VCHGVSGLLNIKLSDTSYLINNKKVTGYADVEETFGGTKKIVPYSLQKELKKRGTSYKRGIIPFRSKTCKDGRLLSGQKSIFNKSAGKINYS